RKNRCGAWRHCAQVQTKPAGCLARQVSDSLFQFFTDTPTYRQTDQGKATNRSYHILENSLIRSVGLLRTRSWECLPAGNSTTCICGSVSGGSYANTTSADLVRILSVATR